MENTDGFKKIAFTDFEMSGLDPCKHEILEFGVIVANIETLEIVARMDKKVKPEHLSTADPDSLAFMGYKEENWRDAISLKQALEEYTKLTDGALYAGWVLAIDWVFLRHAYQALNMPFTLDYHAFDIMPLCYEKFGILKLSKVCDHLGIPREPMPHRAINGAEKAYEVYKKLREISV